jgi:hypothetical protein
MKPIETPKVTALNQWYGSARMAAPEEIGRELDGCSHVTIPCGGGLCEVPFITARSLLIGDLHRHMINLARVVKTPNLQPALFRALKRTLFHPDELKDAQGRCRRREELFDDPDSLYAETGRDERFEEGPNLEWAIDYFVCSWMGQGGRAGTRKEFEGSFSFRRNANGGGSSRRFHSMIESLVAWRRCLKRSEFVVEDLFELIKGVKDEEGLGLYLDTPWVDDGDDYKFPFTESDHRRVAREVSRFKQARIVIRYGDHPLVRELYPAFRFNVIDRSSRTQANKDKREVLILNGKSLVAA